MHVFGGAFQLGERRDRLPGLAGLRVVDLQQDGLVRLDDQWTTGWLGHGLSFCAGRLIVQRRSDIAAFPPRLDGDVGVKAGR